MIKKLSLVLILALAAFTNNCLSTQKPTDSEVQIVDYNEKRDKEYIVTEFNQNLKELTGGDSHPIDFMLSNKKIYFPSYGIKIVLIDKKPIGFIFYAYETYGATNIKWLAINKAHRGHGYATLLLNYACDDLKSYGRTHARLTVGITNYTARKLYENFGFTTEKIIGEWVYYTKDLNI